MDCHSFLWLIVTLTATDPPLHPPLPTRAKRGWSISGCPDWRVPWADTEVGQRTTPPKGDEHVGRGKNIIGRSCHKYHFCRHKRFVGQTRVCRDKHKTSFVATKICLPQQLFWRKNYLLRLRVCHDKSFVATSILVCRDKNKFVATKHLSIFCRDKIRDIIFFYTRSSSRQW